jgi:hypothetical protein
MMKKRNLAALVLAASCSLTLTAAAADDPPQCPMHAEHMKAVHDMDHRGAEAMGFSQEATKHSFRLHADGGAIEVRAVDAADADSIGRIRMHLGEIAKSFPKGDFAKPEYIHGRTPDGVKEMLELLPSISWRYEELDGGARVRIRSKDPRAVEAIQAFLRFQIADHRTGDSGKVE